MGQIPGSRPWYNWGKKVFIRKGHQGLWGYTWGLGKGPWGSKQWGIVVGHLRGLAGTFLNLGTLTIGRSA